MRRTGTRQPGLWPLRALWAGVAVTVGGPLADALSGASPSVQVVAGAGAWAAWAAVLLAVSVPRAVSLTAVRIGAPGALAVALWAGVRTGDASGGLGATWAAATLAVGLAAAVGDALVDGSSYGPERRFALRTPALLLLGPVPMVVAVAVAGSVTGPLLLAAGAWAAGAVVTVVGGALAVLAGRALHQLSRRWVVFVPAGLVLHDPLLLGDPVLFRRQAVARLGPAPAGTAVTEATDVTGRAPGLVLELVLHRAATVVLVERAPGRRVARPVETERLLFTPVRPGAVLAEAASRRLPVG